MTTVPNRTADLPAARYNTPPSLVRDSAVSTTSNAAQRIHILGTGSVGKFLAHAIKSAPEAPPISLLFHRPAFITSLRTAHCHLSVTSDKVSSKAGPFDVELVLPERGPSHPNSVRSPAHFDRERIERVYAQFVKETRIRQLIVTVKGHQTVSALKPLRDRLGPDSTILFCQNGMGIVEEVCEALWPDERRRPTMMLGVNSHGVHATGPFTAVHAGHGVIYLGILPRTGSLAGGSFPSHTQSLLEHQDVSEEDAKSSLGKTIADSSNDPQLAHISASTRNLIRTLTRIPLLAAMPVYPSMLYQRALEKLAVNAVINPLTTLLDARNGDLLQNHALARCFRLLLLEISTVFRSLPELNGVTNLDIKFSPERLEQMIISVAGQTADNISSMLQDVRRGTQTEIDYMNGYVVKRGEDNGVRAVMNYLVMNMVKGKEHIVSKEVDDYAHFSEKL